MTLTPSSTICIIHVLQLHRLNPQFNLIFVCTKVASLAGAGTLSLEFELLSRLTGDLSFGKAAKLATRALWMRGSPGLNLFGKHIDTHSGLWIERLRYVWRGFELQQLLWPRQRTMRVKFTLHSPSSYDLSAPLPSLQRNRK